MQIHNIFSMQPEIRSVVADVSVVSNRAVGIELEVENAGGLREGRFWNVISDGSLRNDGRELLFRQPLAGADIRSALHELVGILHSNANITTGERTSLHVHVDVRDLTPKQVQNILVTYIATESALYKMGGKHRYDNIYCPGVSAALGQMETMRKLLRDDHEYFQSACFDWCKYTGINLRSITERGSIEFRAHEGTTDVRRISRWVNILLTMVEYAINKDSYEAVIEDTKDGALPLLSKVYGPYADVLSQDGGYVDYYKNNLINLVDLTNVPNYRPTRAESSNTSEHSDDVADVISLLRTAISNSN